MHPSHRGMVFLLSLGSLPIACGEDHDADTLVGGTNPPTAGEQGDEAGDEADDADGGDAGTTTTGGEPTTTATGGPTSEPTTAATAATTPPTTDDSTTGATDPATSTTGVDSDTSEGFITTQEASGETSDTNETTDPPEPATDPICIAYGKQVEGCLPYDAATVAAYCQQNKELGLRSDGQPCPDAFDAFYVCLSKLGCEGFTETACPEERAAIEAACPNLLGP